MIITIDTNILVQAFKNSEQDHLFITVLIGRNGRKLGCDGSSEGTIFKEYRQNVGKLGMYQKWFHRLVQQQAIHYQGRYNLPDIHQHKLKEWQCHEPSDLVFIGVAFYSDKVLISEDSDVGKGPKGNQQPHPKALHYLSTKMGLTVLDAQEACQFFGEG